MPPSTTTTATSSALCVTNDVTHAFGPPNNRLHWREKKVAFGFQLFSAALSLTVGVLWLVLKSLGLLEQIFG